MECKIVWEKVFKERKGPRFFSLPINKYIMWSETFRALDVTFLIISDGERIADDSATFFRINSKYL